MKNTIIMWTMLVLLSFLTACGGSDSSGGDNFVKSDDSADQQDDAGDDTTNDDGTPDVADSSAVVGLGLGSGDEYEPNVARTGITGSLSASGSTTVTVDIVDTENGNETFTGVREISFVSTCSSAGLAEFTPESVKASGSATVTYKDLGCGRELGATDAIVAFIANEADNPNATASTTINVMPAEIGAIQFLEASPSLIALSGYGAGSVPSLSTVSFQVLDRSGNPMPERTVHFELDYDYGGASLSLAEAITGSDGSVSVILNAGSAAGVIRVKASIDIRNADADVIDTISTMSVPITMATSLGDQSSFSLSASPYNPSGWTKDGAIVSLGVRIADHYQNPVIDGTRVYFRASAGLIQPSCETTAGKCNVTWESSNPRPADGYVTVVAFTRGQGDFQDKNGNGLFDLGESFTAYGESFIDANGNGSFETEGQYQPVVDIDEDGVPEFKWGVNDYMVYVDDITNGYQIASSNFYEEPIDSNNNGVLDAEPGDKYQGVNCSEDAFTAGHCAEQINLVGQVRLQMSQGNDAYIEGPFLWNDTLERYDTSETVECVDASSQAGPQKVAWRVADSEMRRNHLPVGSNIVIETDDVDVLSSKRDGNVISITPAPVFPVWNAAWLLDAENVGKTLADKKYEYLKRRSHLVEAEISRPETFTSINGIGTAEIAVTTVDGEKISDGSLDVDLLGYRVNLTLGVFPKDDINLRTAGTSTYTIKIKNGCKVGLPTNATLLISLANGTLDSVATSGGAGASSIDGNTALVAINSTDTAVVDLTISADSVSDIVTNGLEVSFFVPDGLSDISLYKLDDFSITD